MSEPIRTSDAKRKQLAAALKRNMARRKGVIGRHPVEAPGQNTHENPRMPDESDAA